MKSINIIPALIDNYIYLMQDVKSNTTIVVDPGESEGVLQFLLARNISLNYIWITHHHADHTNGNLKLKEATGAQVVAFAEDFGRIPGADIKVEKSFYMGESIVQVLHIPGHTSGHVAYYINGILFCGDTLFSGGCGKVFEGTMLQMFNSLSLLAALPSNTQVYCGHEYTVKNCEFALTLEPNNIYLQNKLKKTKQLRREGVPTIPSTIEEELLFNPFLRINSTEIRGNLKLPEATDLEVFTAMRKLKDKF